MKLDQMTTEQRIKYLEDTDHLVVKWVNHLDNSISDIVYYAGEYDNGFQRVSSRLCDAIIYDTKYFAVKIPGYTLVPFTKRELFKARLKDE